MARRAACYSLAGEGLAEEGEKVANAAASEGAGALASVLEAAVAIAPGVEMNKEMDKVAVVQGNTAVVVDDGVVEEHRILAVMIRFGQRVRSCVFCLAPRPCLSAG